MSNQPYKQIRQITLQRRNNKVEQQLKQVCEIIRKYDIMPQRFLKLTVVQAIDQLNNGTINSEVLVAALAYNSATIGKRLNLYTVTNFDQALQMARACDAKRKQSGLKNWTFNSTQYQKYLPPLFGVPISIKDVFDIKGLPTTIGLSSRTKPCKQDSPLIKCLKNSGAIPFIKSNTPQYCMSAQTNNNLWGRSISPWNQLRSVGGTSGGQGGLIAAGCSIIGVGSDIGGSIRLPAQHCGVVGLKTSSKRVSNVYHAELSKVFNGMSTVLPLCIGPLAKCAQGLALFMKLVTNLQHYQNSHDPYTKIIPFDQRRYLNVKNGSKKYKIGYITKLAQIDPSATSTRALNEVIQILRKLGHELVPIKIPNQKQLIREYLTQISIEKGKYMRQILAGEKPSLQNQMVLDLLEMSTPMRAIASFYAKHALPSAYYYSFSKKINNVMEYQTHIGEIAQLKSNFINYWRQQQLDFIICPGFPCAAIPHGQSNKLGFPLAYTFIWNILDMVAGALPVTVVRQQQQIYKPTQINMFSKQMIKCIAGSKGLPAGVQVIGMPYAEEEVLGIMEVLQREIGFNNKYGVEHRGGEMRVSGGFTID